MSSIAFGGARKMGSGDGPMSEVPGHVSELTHTPNSHALNRHADIVQVYRMRHCPRTSATNWFLEVLLFVASTEPPSSERLSLQCGGRSTTGYGLGLHYVNLTLPEPKYAGRRGMIIYFNSSFWQVSFTPVIAQLLTILQNTDAHHLSIRNLSDVDGYATSGPFQ
jgi:hypothetical protein